jgi:hypothetical protein
MACESISEGPVVRTVSRQTLFAAAEYAHRDEFGTNNTGEQCQTVSASYHLSLRLIKQHQKTSYVFFGVNALLMASPGCCLVDRALFNTSSDV